MDEPVFAGCCFEVEAGNGIRGELRRGGIEPEISWQDHGQGIHAVVPAFENGGGGRREEPRAAIDDGLDGSGGGGEEDGIASAGGQDDADVCGIQAALPPGEDRDGGEQQAKENEHPGWRAAG